MSEEMSFEEFVASGALKLPTYCIFCGNKPKDKTLEHVIPRWLIRHTGKPNRIADFGHNWFSRDGKDRRKFSFDSFRFPACDGCNKRYSALETAAKPIVLKLESNTPISGLEFDMLFDWFDKIRTGLWLAFSLLNKNHLGLNPNFYIEQRIGENDRLIIIYRIDSDQKGIGFGCFDTPVAPFMPSCFTFRINDLYFINVSTHFLLAESFGLPYANYHGLVGYKDKFGTNLIAGKEKLQKNFNIADLPKNGLCFGQSIRPRFYKNADDKFGSDQIPQLYKTPYAKKMYSLANERRTMVYMQCSGALLPVNDRTPFEWSKYMKFKISDDVGLMRVISSALKIQRNLYLKTRPKIFEEVPDRFPTPDKLFQLVVANQNRLIEKASTPAGGRGMQ